MPALAIICCTSIFTFNSLASLPSNFGTFPHPPTAFQRWRNLLSPLTNVKVPHVAGGLIDELCCFLRSENGEPPLELFPDLKELIYYKGGDPSEAFTSFINT
ncbi:hypothetical protein F5148DRAFT_689423 [Russula earlei]|uniref:Uncharacterized protein n=1 Tax=Russula earlei TaxID=71964 RepID=A0ACC0TU09_9AGAM|nr:hypothetical protein F5148DRAFT_689423 [Russula earlei]